MDVFEFRDELVNEYQRFARSFTRIRAPDIHESVGAAYDSGRFWPAPLVQLNPNFETGGTIDDLVNAGVLDDTCARIFRLKDPKDTVGKQLELHRHQAEAIEIAKRGESYVLTTGTGSGKSLSYFIPIIDDVLRRKKTADKGEGIAAIVVYPMNALCNSQREELHKYLTLGFGEGNEPVTFARYTGQESNEERERIAKNPPDILLTNYVMLELIMTRFQETDKAVRKHAEGLRFLVLDEMHTYRGRQGADVAMLVRRVRERFNRDLLCVGTSATMATEGSAETRNAAVASIASRLFGAPVKAANIVAETLKPVTADPTPIDGSSLRSSIENGVPAFVTTYDDLSKHPVAAWVERKLGLHKEENGKFVRLPNPLSVLQASKHLAKETGLEIGRCQDFLQAFLLMAYRCRDGKGRSFFAFRLHQFISGAWNAYSTLEARGERYITLEGQQFTPGDRERPLFALSFCRQCGQEYFPVWTTLEEKRPRSFSPRDLTERSNEDEDVQFGYLMPDSAGEFDPNDPGGHFPEEWLDFSGGVPRLKGNIRKRQPIGVTVDTRGEVAADGLKSWYIPGNFRFCLNPDCDAYYDSYARSDLGKLSGLSSEGRSSATTVLALSSLKHLIGTDLDQATKKLLAFTDNRQDASLQAGHFNDFIQVLLLRGALLAAIKNAPQRHLSDETLTQSVLERLRLSPTDYAASPESKGIKAQSTEKTLRDVLGYRLYFDLQRGWRITNPNLEQLELLQIRYRGLTECCEDHDEWRGKHPLLSSITPEKRAELASMLLDRMRRSLCVKTIYLDPNFQDQLRNRSFNDLKEPWSLPSNERPLAHAFMVPRTRSRRRRQDFRILHVSHRSVFGARIKAHAFWEPDNPHYPPKFDEETYNAVIDGALRALETYGLVESTDLGDGRMGYRISGSAFEWHLHEDERNRGGSANTFFRALYENVAKLLDSEECPLQQLEAREHTAQVEPEIRQDRETRFRKGLGAGGLPILFCSPTMELGVDIASLNAVYLRNVPPTPANYAQRSGRAGRSGQPALVISYCAARSPHDQYFFANPERMVAGAVNPPTIDLANEELIRSHLQAVWLAETNMKLSQSVKELLDIEQPAELPLLDEIAEQIGSTNAVRGAERRARNILESLKPDLNNQSAPWFVETWLGSAMNSAERRFDEAFERWRSLYRATSSQMNLAHSVLNNAVAGEKERQEAKARHDEAYTQQNLLLGGKTTTNSDFYTYRYLASEGFLPGYNFPRLPLMAFIPGRREKSPRESFLSRPRFLGLSEFGPQSYIYHEGSTYRVKRAIFAIGEEASVTAKLPVQSARICPACGYGHFRDQRDFEKCMNCGEALGGGRVISNLFRIEQVSTRQATRITSDEEERQRQGYEMVTTLRFSEENGRSRVSGISVDERGETLLELRYGPASTLWRLNLGWRRRKEKSIYGFSVDTSTGEWTKDPQAPTDAEDDAVREGGAVQRITPFVEDTRNILIVRPKVPLSETAMISLQYALKRGIEQEFQLEESELAAEPLPELANRSAILFYESAEGGAGVLTRVASDRTAISRIARRALDVCHFNSASGRWTGIDDLMNQNHDCEAGCYRCLLSYYNQPDHPKIDRKDSELLELLCRLANGVQSDLPLHFGSSDTFEQLRNASTSSLERAWLDYIKSSGFKLPDISQPYLKDYNTRPDFAYTDCQALIFIDGPHHERDAVRASDANTTHRLENGGYTVVRFPADRSVWGQIASQYSWIFGSGSPTDSK